MNKQKFLHLNFRATYLFKGMMILCMGFLPLLVTAQTREVSGQVKNRAGNNLSNVSVIVAGSERGTTTDANGRFAILANNNDSLVLMLVMQDRQF